jgi:hypothetical protein
VPEGPISVTRAAGGADVCGYHPGLCLRVQTLRVFYPAENDGDWTLFAQSNICPIRIDPTTRGYHARFALRGYHARFALRG